MKMDRYTVSTRELMRGRGTGEQGGGGGAGADQVIPLAKRREDGNGRA